MKVENSLSATNQRARIREGLILAVIVMIAAIGIRMLVSEPGDYRHYEGLGHVTGIDFGEWPQFFNAGGGGDGEIFAVMASDPIAIGAGREIPVASYRYSRIGFPALGWALSLGNSEFILPALALIGLASLGGIGFLSGYLHHELGWRSWLLVANPAAFIGFNGDTAEPLAIFVLILLMGTSLSWTGVALGAIRPTYLVSTLGKWKPMLLGVGTALVIRALAVWKMGESDLGQLGAVFVFPLRGYLGEPSVAGYIIAGSALATLVAGVRKRDTAWVASAVFVLLFGPVILMEPINAVRAAAMLPILWAFGPSESQVFRWIRDRLARPGLRAT